MRKGRYGDCTDHDEIDAGGLEAFDDFGLGRIGEGGLPDQSEGRVTGFCAGLDYEFTDVTSASDEENLGFGLGHWIGELEWD